MKIEIAANKYADHDDCLEAAASAYITAHPTLRGWDLQPEWLDEQRDVIILTVPEVDHALLY